jgi:DNA topoisomerase-1
MPPKKNLNTETKSISKSSTSDKSTKSKSATSEKSILTKTPKTSKTTKFVKKVINGDDKILVIVESPGKINTIQSILGDDYIVAASVGHIIDLAAKSMSIDIEHDFKPTYENMPGKDKVIYDLKKLAKSSSDILLATDEDREGEMIAWSLAYVLGIKDPKRITFNSITHDEILNAVENPRDIDLNLVDAQKSRRILDRIVGYEISPLLWKSIGQSLSAGRVQSVVVRIILDREREIQQFLKSTINSAFRFNAKFYKDIIAQLYTSKKSANDNINEKINLYDEEYDDDNDDNDEDDKVEKDLIDEKISGVIIKTFKPNIQTEKNAREIMAKIINSEFKISGKGDRIQIKKPSPPFTTSTIQQESARKLGFTIKRTMMAAQNLYEAGHITYMRTDSTNLSKEALKSIGEYIINTFGKNYHIEKNYIGKSKNTQEAHECIRPTHIDKLGLSEHGKIGSDECKLYLLIWKRAISSQMSLAKLNISTTQISISKLKDYYFQTEISSIIFDGFLKVYNIKNIEENNSENISTKLPNIGDKLNLNELNVLQDYQRPPPRYNEASLVNKLDPKNLNIGRPSTYSSIINKIQERGYVEKKNNDGIEKESLQFLWTSDTKKISETKKIINIGKDSGRLTPTAIGTLVTDFLVNYFPDIMDYKFTSTMEEKLDGIAGGDIKMLNLLTEFYKTDFHPIIENLSKDKIKYIDKDKKNIGKDENNNDVIVTIKRYGPVVIIEKDGKAINIAPLKSPLTIDNITLQDALKILSYPKFIGKYNNKEIKLYKGKYGFYAKYGDFNINLSSIENEEDITLEKIIKLMDDKKSKNLWEGKEGKTYYTVLDGQYGKYIKIEDKSKKTAKPMNVKLPIDIEIKDLTMEKIKLLVEEGKKNKFKSQKYKKKPE